MLSGTDSTEQLQANFTFFNPVLLLNIPFKRRMGWGRCLWSVWRDDRQEEASGGCWRIDTVGRETQVPAHSPVVLSITAQASKNHHRDLIPTVLTCPPKYQCWENKAFKWDHPVMLKFCKTPFSEFYTFWFRLRSGKASKIWHFISLFPVVCLKFMKIPHG